MLEIFENYNKIEDTDNFLIGNICDPFDYNKKDKKRIEWDLTFHVNQCGGTGPLRTQYDFIISMLVKGILNNSWELHKVYLPLLFLIRHSIELALKLNIERIRKHSVALISNKDIENEHSLCILYNIFNKYLSS